MMNQTLQNKINTFQCNDATHLWCLKLSANDYQEILNYLRIIRWTDNHAMPCDLLRRCAAIYVSEYWRREYVGGAYSWQGIFKSIDQNFNEKYPPNFEEAVKKGAKLLGCQPVKASNGANQYLDSFLYQGGLPMQWIVNSINANLSTSQLTTNVWYRFACGLVCRHIDFTALPLGVIASTSKSMRDFCDQLCNGLATNDVESMPFNCNSNNDPWFLALKQLETTERQRQRNEHPFNLSWELELDTIDNNFVVRCIFEGPNAISNQFLTSNSILRNFNLQVCVDGQTRRSFEYYDAYCAYKVRDVYNSYKNQETISVTANGQELLSDDLDMCIPHLFYQDGHVYRLGNRLGSERSILVYPSMQYAIEEMSNDIHTNNYAWNNENYTILFILANFAGQIVLRDTQSSEQFTFSAVTSLSWTDKPKGGRVLIPGIIETLYDATNCTYTTSDDSGQTTPIQPRNVEYRSLRSNAWSNQPPYGKIYVRQSGATHVQMINVGPLQDLQIQVNSANATTCCLSFYWRHGTIRPMAGTFNPQTNEWTITIKDVQDDNLCIPVKLIPPGTTNDFDLHYHVPFRRFCIYDPQGNEIRTGSSISTHDVQNYRYDCYGQDVTINGKTWRWDSNGMVLENGQNRIPYFGNLVTLLGGVNIDEGLQNSLNNVVWSQFDIHIRYANNAMALHIKRFPYRLVQEGVNNDETIKVENNPSYNERLRIISLAQPVQNEELQYDPAKGGYSIPAACREWGKCLVVGDYQGHILPFLSDTLHILTDEKRTDNRHSSIHTISQELSCSSIQSNVWQHTLQWFNALFEYDIPASSILEFVCIAKNPELLLKLVTYLYISNYSQSNNADDGLLQKCLLRVSNDLSFQWYWLLPYIKGINMQDIMCVQETTLQAYYVRWYLATNDIQQNLSNLQNELQNMSYLIQILDNVKSFCYELCRKSLLVSAVSSNGVTIANDIVEHFSKGQALVYDPTVGHLSNVNCSGQMPQSVDNFFQSIAVLANLTPNEKEFYQRVNIVVDALHKTTNIFGNLGQLSDEESDVARRSIICHFRSNTDMFLIALNNNN